MAWDHSLHVGSIHRQQNQASLSPGRHGVRHVLPPFAHESGALPVALLDEAEHVPHQVVTLEEGGHGSDAGGMAAFHSDLEEGHKCGALFWSKSPITTSNNNLIIIMIMTSPSEFKE